MSRLSPGVILEALREAVTIIEPGEILAVRVDPGSCDMAALGQMRDHAECIRAEYGVTVMFVEGGEFARLKGAGAVSA